MVRRLVFLGVSFVAFSYAGYGQTLDQAVNELNKPWVQANERILENEGIRILLLHPTLIDRKQFEVLVDQRLNRFGRIRFFYLCTRNHVKHASAGHLYTVAHDRSRPDEERYSAFLAHMFFVHAFIPSLCSWRSYDFDEGKLKLTEDQKKKWIGIIYGNKPILRSAADRKKRAGIVFQWMRELSEKNVRYFNRMSGREKHLRGELIPLVDEGVRKSTLSINKAACFLRHSGDAQRALGFARTYLVPGCNAAEYRGIIGILKTFGESSDIALINKSLSRITNPKAKRSLQGVCQTISARSRILKNKP